MAIYETSNIMFTLPRMNAPELVVFVAQHVQAFNIESIAIGYTVDGYDNVNAHTVTVTITETQAIIDIFVDRVQEWFVSTHSGWGLPQFNS